MKAPQPEHHYCESCSLAYNVDDVGNPVTTEPYTCDDCGGYVGPEVEPQHAGGGPPAGDSNSADHARLDQIRREAYAESDLPWSEDVVGGSRDTESAGGEA